MALGPSPDSRAPRLFKSSSDGDIEVRKSGLIPLIPFHAEFQFTITWAASNTLRTATFRASRLKAGFSCEWSRIGV